MGKWLLIIVSAVVVYLLSFPPLAVFMNVKPRLFLRDLDFPAGPRWLVVYGRPYEVLMKESPVRDPLRRYFNLWWSLRNP